MTRYAVIKIFDTLKEADQVAELITEDDIVMVLPLDDTPPEDDAWTWPLEEESVEGTPPPTAAADSSSSGPRTAPGSGRLSPAESERPAHNVIPFPGWSVKV